MGTFSSESSALTMTREEGPDRLNSISLTLPATDPVVSITTLPSTSSFLKSREEFWDCGEVWVDNANGTLLGRV